MIGHLPGELSPEIERYRRLALLAGGVGVLAFAVLGFVLPQASAAYLVGYVFWAGVSVACLLLVMLHYLVGGNWGYPVKRFFEAGSLVIIPMALLLIPVILGSRALYPWTDTAHLDELLLHKRPYLNLGAFIVRAVIYFAIWGGLAYLLSQWSAAQDRTADPAISYRAQTLSGPGMVITFVAASFAAIDWCMSREPHWYSSLYGPLLIVGWGLSAFALAIVAIHFLGRHEPLRRVATVDRVHDLGNLMFAFTIIWAYMSFMQFLIMWSGNLSEEIPWYLRRTGGGWQIVAILLMVFQFFLPFFALLFRDVKRGVASLAIISLIILVMRVVDLTWMIVPASNDPAHPTFALIPVLLVPVAVAVVGAFWVGCFLWALGRSPLVPLHNPMLPAPALEHAGGH